MDTFGFAFWNVTITATKKEIKQYMALSTYGVMLFFTSNDPVGLTLLPYPPLGLLALSFLSLGSYLLLLGIFSSAVSVASDTELRRNMKKSIKSESDMLANIGSAEIQHQLQNRALTITKNLKNKLTETTGIESSYDDDDMKEYLKMVIDGRDNRQGSAKIQRRPSPFY